MVSKACESLEAFRSASSWQYLEEVAENTKNIRWQAPMKSFFKVNWETAVNKNNKMMGIGVIVRYSMREVLATLSEPKDYIIAKSTTVLQATNFCQEWEGMRWYLKVILSK